MDFDKWRLFFYIYFVISLLPKLNSCKHCLKLLVRCCLFQVLKDTGCLQLKEETEIGQLELPVVQNRLSRFLGPTARLSRLPQSYEAWEWEGFLDVPGTVWLHENALCFLSAKVLLSYNVHNSSSFIEWYSSWSGVVCFSLIFLDLFPFFEICKGTSSVEATLGRIDWRQLTRKQRWPDIWSGKEAKHNDWCQQRPFTKQQMMPFVQVSDFYIKFATFLG